MSGLFASCNGLHWQWLMNKMLAESKCEWRDSHISDILLIVPSVLWRCWLGGRKGIWPVKTEWWCTGMVICLERDADLHMAQLMPLPLTVSCFSKIQIGFTFLVPAHPGSPGKMSVKRVCVCCWWRKYDVQSSEWMVLGRACHGAKRQLFCQRSLLVDVVLILILLVCYWLWSFIVV